MEIPKLCPRCHSEVRLTDYFCFNCGQNLRPAPPTTDALRQIVVYLESFFLPPYGIILGIRFLKQKDSKSKTIGVVAVILTVLSLFIAIKLTLDFINALNAGINSQLNSFNGL